MRENLAGRRIAKKGFLSSLNSWKFAQDMFLKRTSNDKKKICFFFLKIHSLKNKSEQQKQSRPTNATKLQM